MLRVFRGTLAIAALMFATTPALAQTFSGQALVPINSRAESVQVTDFDGDGRREALVANGWDSNGTPGRLIVINHDPVAGARIARDHTIHTDWRNRAPMVVARRAGRTPLAVVANTNAVYTLRFEGGAIAQTRLTTTMPADYLEALDLDGDGTDEVVIHSWSQTGAVYRVDAAGTGLVLAYPFTTTAAGYNDLASGDLNGDGHVDLVVMSGQGTAPNLSILFGDGQGGLAAPTTWSVTPWEGVRGVAVGDVDGDGLDDVVLTRGRNSPTFFYVALQRAGGLVQAPTISTYDIPSEALIGDVDLDGRNEVFVLHHAWNALSIYQTDDAGVVPGGERITMHAPSYYASNAMALGDLDGDGCPDLAVANDLAGLAIRYGGQCPPPTPTNDLAASATLSATAANAGVVSIAGNAPAEDIEAQVSFTVDRGKLRVSAPAGCVAAGTHAYRCSRGALPVGASDLWAFGISGVSKNATLRLRVLVTSTTEDGDLSNNLAEATRRF